MHGHEQGRVMNVIYINISYYRDHITYSTHLRLGLLSGLFLSGFPTKILYVPLCSPIRATCPE